MTTHKLTRSRDVPGTAQGYRDTHKRLREARGPASGHTCACCGVMARHWSYDRQAPDERWCHIGPYSADLDHYQPVCASCHVHRDPPRTESQKLAVQQSLRPAVQARRRGDGSPSPRVMSYFGIRRPS
jgi:hypothetical protein